MTFDNFWGFSAKHPEKLAIVESDERTIHQAEFLAGINQLSHGLRALGLQRGDSIAAMLPNSPEALEVFLAMQQIGLYLTPINFHLVGPEIAYIVTDSEAKILVTHERFADACAAAAGAQPAAGADAAPRRRSRPLDAASLGARRGAARAGRPARRRAGRRPQRQPHPHRGRRRGVPAAAGPGRGEGTADRMTGRDTRDRRYRARLAGTRPHP
jgi:acyl-CoA synthetase (AMP-forming)/AMP-acid ligase II